MLRPASLLLAAALAAAPASAGTYVLPAVADATIFFDSFGAADLADGQGDYLWGGETAGGLDRRTLIRFDLSAIPAGERVSSASVTFSLNRSVKSGNDQTAIHRLLAAWNEGSADAGSNGSGAVASPGDATWNHRIHSATPWASPGGDYVPAASDTQVAGNVAGPTPIVFNSAQVAADVQAWLDAPAANHGWILIVAPNGGAITAKRFASRTDPIYRPTLTVQTETVPPPPPSGQVPLPAWATALGALALGFAAVRRLRRRQAP